MLELKLETLCELGFGQFIYTNIVYEAEGVTE